MKVREESDEEEKKEASELSEADQQQLRQYQKLSDSWMYMTLVTFLFKRDIEEEKAALLGIMAEAAGLRAKVKSIRPEEIWIVHSKTKDAQEANPATAEINRFASSLRPLLLFFLLAQKIRETITTTGDTQDSFVKQIFDNLSVETHESIIETTNGLLTWY